MSQRLTQAEYLEKCRSLDDTELQNMAAAAECEMVARGLKGNTFHMIVKGLSTPSEREARQELVVAKIGMLIEENWQKQMDELEAISTAIIDTRGMLLKKITESGLEVEQELIRVKHDVQGCKWKIDQLRAEINEGDE